MPRTLIVDGDIVLFQIGRVTEDVTDFGDTVLESYDMDAAIRLINNELDSISKKTGYKREEIVFAISDAANYRKEFFPTYKGNRKHIKKPVGLKAMRQYMLDNAEKYQTIMMEKLEADDVMGIYGTVPTESNKDNDMAIYSQDKDLFTVPVKQWDFKKKKFIQPTPMESTKFLYKQVLMGDAVDGYKGCPRIGKIKAEKALEGCGNEMAMLHACHELFYKAYKEEAKEKLLEQMGQARILHYMDFQLLTQANMLYNPYNMMGVSDEMLQMWEEAFRRSNESNGVRKNKSRGKEHPEV
jgi:DNA polymerase I